MEVDIEYVAKFNQEEWAQIQKTPLPLLRNSRPLFRGHLGGHLGAGKMLFQRGMFDSMILGISHSHHRRDPCPTTS